MFTVSNVKKHVYGLSDGALLSTRDLLSYGTRSAVDQAVATCIRVGLIQRLARGLFIKLDPLIKPKVPVETVARAKAAAFRKRILESAATIGKPFRIHEQRTTEIMPLKKQENAQNREVVAFITSGCASQFRYGDVIIRFRPVAQRQFELGDTKTGKTLRLLWTMGKHLCRQQTLMMVTSDWSRHDRDAAATPAVAAMLPDWLWRCFRGRLGIQRRQTRKERLIETHQRQLRERQSQSEFIRDVLHESGCVQTDESGTVIWRTSD